MVHNLTSAHKVNYFGHLDLGEDTAAGLVIAKVGGVADGKRVRAFHGNLSWLAAV